ncbi:hypothetical protein WG901_22760 [Novosphingobium sp. PS1R-30]|uniref:Uncharacterized protein n=1 Tax=Novosphingobium anseongense TaxID=3133436 RepID=A0ABU8S2N7_9SPHN
MHTEEDGTEIHLSKTEARAGSRTKVNRNALVGGLVLVIVVFTIILGFGFLQTDKTGADEVNAQNVAASDAAP